MSNEHKLCTHLRGTVFAAVAVAFLTSLASAQTQPPFRGIPGIPKESPPPRAFADAGMTTSTIIWKTHGRLGDSGRAVLLAHGFVETNSKGILARKQVPVSELKLLLGFRREDMVDIASCGPGEPKFFVELEDAFYIVTFHTTGSIGETLRELYYDDDTLVDVDVNTNHPVPHSPVLTSQLKSPRSHTRKPGDDARALLARNGFSETRPGVYTRDDFPFTALKTLFGLEWRDFVLVPGEPTDRPRYRVQAAGAAYEIRLPNGADVAKNPYISVQTTIDTNLRRSSAADATTTTLPANGQ